MVRIERPAVVTNLLADNGTIAQVLGWASVVTILAKRLDRLEQEFIDVIGTAGAPAFDVIHTSCWPDRSGAGTRRKAGIASTAARAAVAMPPYRRASRGLPWWASALTCARRAPRALPSAAALKRGRGLRAFIVHDQAPRPGSGPIKPSNFPCFGGGSHASLARAAGDRPKLEPNRSARSAALYATPIKGLGTVISPRSLLRVMTSDGSNASCSSAVFQRATICNTVPTPRYRRGSTASSRIDQALPCALESWGGRKEITCPPANVAHPAHRDARGPIFTKGTQ